MTTRETLDRWMDAYRVAWTSNDPDDIRALFAEDGSYRFHPYDEPTVGHEAIVAAWLESRDEEGTWNFEWTPLALDGDRAIIEGRTGYPGETDYRNLWVIDFAGDGRATSFTEWFMAEPS